MKNATAATRVSRSASLPRTGASAISAIHRFVRDRRGANMVEYILLVGVVALISIAAFKMFGSKVQDKIKEQGGTVGQINAGTGN